MAEYPRTVLEFRDWFADEGVPGLWLLGTHQGAVSVAHIDYYLDEYTFRFNRRKSASRGLLFLRLPANEIRGGQRPTENQPIDVT